MTLAEPLARAMTAALYDTPDARVDADRILAVLRADPATLAALAEALHASAPKNHNLGEGPQRAICNSAEAHERRAAAIADALFGAKP